MQPMEIKCMSCKYFIGVRPTRDLMDIFYYCKAYPKEPGIPEEIRGWVKPHTKVRDDQVGDYVFEKVKE